MSISLSDCPLYVPGITTVDTNRTIRVTNLLKGKVQRSTLHPEPIHCLCSHPFGEAHVIGTSSSLTILDENLNQRFSVRIGDSCLCASFSTDGEMIAFSDGNLLKCASMSSRRLTHSPAQSSHASPIRSIHWMTNNTRILTVSATGEFVVWNTATWNVLFQYKGGSDLYTNGAVATDGYYIYCATQDNCSVFLLAIKRTGIFAIGNSLLEKGVKDPISSMKITSNGMTMVAGTVTGKLIIAALPLVGSGCVVRSVHNGIVRCIALSQPYSCIITGGDDGDLHLFDVMHPFKARFESSVPISKVRKYILDHTSVRQEMPYFSLLCKAAGSWEDCQYLSEALLSTCSEPKTQQNMYPALKSIREDLATQNSPDDPSYCGLRALCFLPTTWTALVPGGDENVVMNTSQIPKVTADTTIDTSDLEAQRGLMTVPVWCRLRGDVESTECSIMIPPREKFYGVQDIVERVFNRRLCLSFYPTQNPGEAPLELTTKTTHIFWNLPDEQRRLICTSLFPGKPLNLTLGSTPPPSRKSVRSTTSMSNFSIKSSVASNNSTISQTQLKSMVVRLSDQAVIKRRDVLKKAEERMYGTPPALFTDPAKITAVVERLTVGSHARHHSEKEKLLAKYSPQAVAELKEGLKIPEAEVSGIVDRLYTEGKKHLELHHKVCAEKLFKPQKQFPVLGSKEELGAWLENRKTPIGRKTRLQPLPPIEQKKVTKEEWEAIVQRLRGGK